MRAPALAAALLLLSGCAAVGPHAPQAAIAPAAVPKTYQWLQGSGEAAALSRQSYGALTRYVLATVAERAKGGPVEGAVLADGAALRSPAWAACGAKPAAIVLDMDETAILNTGANYDSARRGDPAFDVPRWDAWEQDGASFVDPVPGAVEALAALRAAGVTPIFISNRQARFSGQATQALAAAGLGDASAGRTMFLREAGTSSGKDMRRATVAAQWCVLAMIGDQLGDFSDLFNAKGMDPDTRRKLAELPGVAARWGQGWFLIPNPVYGPGVVGTLEQVFPDHRWPGPQTKETK
ncbi:HAD family acid phosphatase [Sphingomonas sp. BIUV-7]|uniref:HAD family acid phosphatase n=1 Tax=Sphingomonas natans TaxID=3063330 RepID=A0ABT8Y4B6_9SPHN|nr:HAD family acid phosphatase [Sphingomonas sp. BIUV-7]MDO6413149.1 HAD family acid phosphatase [Sphingomonas sp. BIUV-7]